ncbi:MAG: DUF3822 family protein [Cytophagaceae bacterium]|jgi:hypothetical protein
MLNKLKSAYRLSKRIKDDQLNVDRLSEYDLLLQVNNNLFRVCIIDSQNHRCLFIEDYEFSAVFFPEQIISLLESIYDDHHLLQAGFWRSIKLSFKTQSFTLVPASLFEKDNAADYLLLNSEINSSEEIHYYQQSSLEAVNVFSVEKKIADWFTNAYPSRSVKLLHHTCSFLEGSLHRDNKGQRSLYLNVEKNFFTATVVHDKTIEFCNSFSFSSAEDFVYFVMYVFDQLKLNPESTPVVIWGEIENNSVIYNKLYKYVRFISLGDRPKGLKFSYQFDECFDHRYFDLFTIHFC